jgi:NACalpha-BTF3-like transcription factor
MLFLGITKEEIPNVSRVVVSLTDGSWIEFTEAQVMKLTMRGRPMFQIRGEPKRVIDFPALFGTLFPEGCKYL